MPDVSRVSTGLYSRASACLDPNTKIASAEVEELEELENLEIVASGTEDLEPIEVHDIEEESLTESLEDEKSELHFSLATNPYVHSFFPVVIIDKKMKILFANEACKNLFSGYVDLSGKYFGDVFGKPFGIEGIREIRETIIEGQNVHFWKGEVRIKSRSVISVQIKVYIFPAELDAEDPTEFVVMFDDVTEENKRMTRNIFLSLLEASKMKDSDTGNHIIRVNYYSKRLSEELFRSKNPKYNRIDADFSENIGFLASMHDVGKIGVADDILNKEGPLSDWEWSVMRDHTKNGAFILSSYPNPMAKEIALSHHERWDGSGYPYQLSGEMIPLAARIVTIADVYDALRMERSYKPAYEHAIAVQKMVEGKESHFDPFLMEVFVSVGNDFKQIYEDNFDHKEGKHAS
ncbi:MAG: HD domain-containing protein [Treponema sp.]|jgi:putative two-component system response regulator|nr:HD domain-containing protein [Treponema sp.]